MQPYLCGCTLPSQWNATKYASAATLNPRIELTAARRGGLTRTRSSPIVFGASVRHSRRGKLPPPDRTASAGEPETKRVAFFSADRQVEPCRAGNPYAPIDVSAASRWFARRHRDPVRNQPEEAISSIQGQRGGQASALLHYSILVLSVLSGR